MAQNSQVEKKLKQKRRRELSAYFWEIVRKEGLLSAVLRTFSYVGRRSGGKRGRFLPKPAELARQREADTIGWPRISVCVPVYNPARQFFAELVASVMTQTYGDWELCIADASERPEVAQAVLTRYEDERILYETLDENGGISANTNHAAGMASGHYLAFLDHDDLLSPNALYEVAKRIASTEAGFVYSDEALFTDDYKKPTAAHFKPDYSPQYLLNVNYIAHLAVVRKDLFQKMGGFRGEYDGSQDLDLYLRVLEETGAAEHIQKVLYYWRQHPQSTSTGVQAKPYVSEAAMKAVDAHLKRIGVRGFAVEGLFPSTYKVNYAIRELPLVSVIIPNSEHVDDLERCIASIYAHIGWRQFEIVIVENNSKTMETFNYYEEVAARHPECRVAVYDEAGFNFSKICNFGRQRARGEYLLFLNNDTQVVNAPWMNEMLQLCQLDGVGVVGAMLYYPDDTVQHAGVIVGLGGYAGHSHKYAPRGHSGYMFRQACVQELSAVTGACMMVKRRVFDEVGGFDEWFSVAYNDVDFCLRVRGRGHSVLFTPYAELIHHESKSRGSDETGAAKIRFAAEQERLLERYGESLLHDPYYNPWLTLDRENFTEADVPPRDDENEQESQ